MEILKVYNSYFVFDRSTHSTYEHRGTAWAQSKVDFSYIQDDFGRDAIPMTVYELAMKVDIEPLKQLIKQCRQELYGDQG